MAYAMMSGYCYEGPDWEIVVYTPNGTEQYLRNEMIDDVVCAVFRCADGLERAQMESCCWR